MNSYSGDGLKFMPHYPQGAARVRSSIPSFRIIRDGGTPLERVDYHISAVRAMIFVTSECDSF